VSWGDDQVAYHRPSGRTHFLNAASHFLISELLREPRDLEAVVDAFLTDDGNGANSDALVREEISRLLDRLEQLGLISPA